MFVKITFFCLDHREFVVECTESQVTGTWEKKIFMSDTFEISLNDPSCHTYMENNTHVWITAKFSECASIVYERGFLIYQENSALVS